MFYSPECVAGKFSEVHFHMDHRADSSECAPLPVLLGVRQLGVCPDSPDTIRLATVGSSSARACSAVSCACSALRLASSVLPCARSIAPCALCEVSLLTLMPK